MYIFFPKDNEKIAFLSNMTVVVGWALQHQLFIPKTDFQRDNTDQLAPILRWMVDFIRFFFFFFCHEYSLENRACNLKRTEFVIQTMQY